MPVSPQAERRCLLLVDVFSHFRFEDGEALAEAQHAVAPAMAAVLSQSRRHGIPVVYCNDNFGRWRDTWQDVLAFTASEGPPASRALLEQLRPSPDDIVLLKSRHSAFYHTQMAALLADLGIKELAVGGAATDACVHSTAVDAHVRGFDVHVIVDAVAAASATRGKRALDHMRESLGLHVGTFEQWLAKEPSAR